MWQSGAHYWAPGDNLYKFIFTEISLLFSKLEFLTQQLSFIIIIVFDEPYDIFKVHYSIKTKHVSDETSSIVSCTVFKY